MTRFISNTTTLAAALLITLASLNAVVTVPPAEATAMAAPILA